MTKGNCNVPWWPSCDLWNKFCFLRLFENVTGTSSIFQKTGNVSFWQYYSYIYASEWADRLRDKFVFITSVKINRSIKMNWSTYISRKSYKLIIRLCQSFCWHLLETFDKNCCKQLKSLWISINKCFECGKYFIFKVTKYKALLKLRVNNLIRQFRFFCNS